MRSKKTDMSEVLEIQKDLQTLQYSESKSSLKAVEADIAHQKRQMEKVQRAKQDLEHEFRVLEEIPEEQTFPSVGGKTQEGTVRKWMNHRKNALQGRINILQQYLTQRSRQEVIER